MIKEYKNGNILIDIKEDIKNGYYDKENFIELLYYHELNLKDYYLEYIDDYPYLVNYRTNFMYTFEDCCINILQYLNNELMRNNFKLRLYPIKKKISKQFFSVLSQRKE